MSFGKIMQSIAQDNIEALDSEFEIEEVIQLINKVDKDIEWMKGYKKYHADKVSSRLDSLSGRKEKLKSIIELTLSNADKKSLSFPGTGKVSIKENKGTWNILDEKKLLDVLSKELDEETYGNIVQEQPAKIAKKDLNKILNTWEKVDKIPDSVRREKTTNSVAVTFEKTIKSIDDADIEVAEGDANIEQYDSLDVSKMTL
jgi:hypothetical protein